MIEAGCGFTKISTDDLKKALRSVHQGHLACPPTIENLTRVGLQHCATTFTANLRGLDEAGVRTVLVCVLAERKG